MGVLCASVQFSVELIMKTSRILLFFVTSGAMAQQVDWVSQIRNRPVYDVRTYGAKCNGSTDDTTALNATIAAAQATSGIVFSPAGTCKALGQIVLPNDSASPTPHQRTVYITGVGAVSGFGIAPQSGSVWDLRYAGAGVAKIDTRGLGLLEIANITMKDDGFDSKAFLQTTNTTLKIHDTAWIGNPAKGGGGSAPDQDVLILGGTSITIGSGTNAAFQGYGTVIDGNFFNRIRRAVYGRTFANAVVVTNNSIWVQCGGTATEAAIDWIGDSGEPDVGGVISNNLIEMTGYVYGIKLEYVSNFSLVSNNFYDADPLVILAFQYLKTNAVRTLVIDGSYDATYTGLTDSGTGNTHLSAVLSQTNKLANPLNVLETITGSNTLTVNTTNAGFDGQSIFSALGVNKWGWYWEHTTNKLCARDYVNSAFRICLLPNGQTSFPTVAAASLGAVPAAGIQIYCTDCTTASPCAGAGSGHMATSNGSAWVCN